MKKLNENCITSKYVMIMANISGCVNHHRMRESQPPQTGGVLVGHTVNNTAQCLKVEKKK